MDNYIINSNTIALVWNNGKTYVYEYDNSFIVNITPNKIIKLSCLYYGCSMEGRLFATKGILGCSSKLPVVIEESNNLVFFPTMSIRDNKCSWFSVKDVDKCISYQHLTVLKFYCNKEIFVNISKYILQNQILKASRLLSILNIRKKY